MKVELAPSPLAQTMELLSWQPSAEESGPWSPEPAWVWVVTAAITTLESLSASVKRGTVCALPIAPGPASPLRLLVLDFLTAALGHNPRDVGQATVEMSQHPKQISC